MGYEGGKMEGKWPSKYRGGWWGTLRRKKGEMGVKMRGECRGDRGEWEEKEGNEGKWEKWGRNERKWGK